MKTSKIYIKDMFGIRVYQLDGGKSVELNGPKGAGKTSVLDAIRFALTNQSERDWIIRQGADEGEIIIETDTGLYIDRKKRETRADAIKVRDGNLMQNRPAEFLRNIFTPLQLNPVEFTQMSRQEKNRVILSLIEFDWDTNWIKEKFGELPQGVDYSKHILEVLSDIQAENGMYYKTRQTLNSEALYKRKAAEDIARTIPDGYNYDYWNEYDIGAKYRELAEKQKRNNEIARAKTYKDNYDNSLRGLQADRDIAISVEEKKIAAERQGLTNTIERLRAEIKAAEDKLAGLGDRLKDKVRVIDAEYAENVAKLDANNQIAVKYAAEKPYETSALDEEIRTAEAMKKHLNEYLRMRDMQKQVDELTAKAEALTEKINLARELPGEILKTAIIPIEGLTVENGIPLVHGRPISNLSEGELLDLCVDVTISRPGQLQILLIDGVEKLDTASRERLYAKCKEKGLQVIASRTTDGDGLTVVEL